MPGTIQKRSASPEPALTPKKRLKRCPEGPLTPVPDSTEEQCLPECRRSPPLWAEMRQSLNSSLPWHKGYQSGDYTRNNVLLGCLLDGFPEERDLIDPSVVIIMNMQDFWTQPILRSYAHLLKYSGGGRDVADGTRANKQERQKDQGYPKMLKSAINAKEINKYVGIVVG